MLTQKQWKIQQLAEHMHNTATSAGIVAANLAALRKPMVSEHGVIADETRIVSLKILEALEKNVYADLSNSEFETIILELSRQTAFAALNAALLAGKVMEHKALAVVADELRYTAMELGTVCGNTHKYKDIPFVSPRSTVVSDTFDLFHATSGQYTWYENARFVQEILNYCPEHIQDNRLVINNTWRDLDAPVIRFGDVPKDAGIVIISDAFNPQKLYAVVAEFKILSLARSYVGVCKPCSAEIPVRECWSASDGSDMIFPDWDALSK